ncbi:MAG TPA: hypothetical protein VH120_05185 [Gemmataceae bacterium]|nr:hypothetical protein [Gemmataceae bacterium]
MLRWINLFLVTLVLAGTIGCGREAERSKNKDQDRPKPAEPAKDK